MVTGIQLRLLALVCGVSYLTLHSQFLPYHATAGDETASGEEYGAIKGQFLLEGTLPNLPPLVEKGNMTINDPAICSAADVPDDSLIVDPTTKGIANVFVYL